MSKKKNKQEKKMQNASVNINFLLKKKHTKKKIQEKYLRRVNKA